MLISLILILSLGLYVIVLVIYGGRYSFVMQEIKSLSKILKLENAKKDKVRNKIEYHTNSIPVNKKRGFLAVGIIFILQLLGNSLLLDDPLVYLLTFASFAICMLSFKVVYWLKGSGTIDDEPRMHGGMRI